MRKLFIYAEGQTEERFIKNLLVPHLELRGIFAQPIVATTKVVKDGPNFKGGIGSYSKAKKEILHLLADSSAIAVTTMVDYYGLPRSFPGRANPQGADCYSHVEFVEQAIGQDIGNPKFRPFLTLHEFEGILFSSPEEMATALPGGSQLAQEFRGIRTQFCTPEEINDDPATAPHMRIIAKYATYAKALHGPLIANRIGLDKIRSECPHFNAWVCFLEKLGQ